MPKISPLGQKLWPTGREHTDTHTQTEKANTEDPFFSKKIFFCIFDFLLKERSDKESTLKHFLVSNQRVL